MYWGEELEFSYRLIKSGYRIQYRPDVMVYHKVNPKGRFNKQKLLYYSFRNRFYATAPHLPKRYLLVNLISWSTIWFFKAMKVNAIQVWIRALYDGVQHLIKVFRSGRTPLDNNQCAYLAKHGGRLWF